jgi:hypothetical protein
MGRRIRNSEPHETSSTACYAPAMLSRKSPSTGRLPRARISRIAVALLPALLLGLTSAKVAAQKPDAQGSDAEKPRIHSVCDISQEFSFYMDGRFHRQYLDGLGPDARNWGSLHRLDLSNVNLLVLTAGDRRIPYSKAAIQHVSSYVREGGALLLMADGNQPMPPVLPLAEQFGMRLTTRRAKKPLRAAASLGADSVSFRGGTVLDPKSSKDWEPLLWDASTEGGAPVLAVRSYGRGYVLIGSRGLFGQRPDASDPINAAWVRPLLARLAGHKRVDAKKPHRSTWVEHSEKVGPLTLEYHDGTRPFAQRIAEEYAAVRPHMVAITGVQPAPGMISRMLILPTGGGGFSSGARIAIGAFWGNYPERRYPMLELISHEAGHSWVLPYPEPLWNEPIATYLGIQVGKRMGLQEAQKTLQDQLRRGRRHDADYTKENPLKENAPRDLVWGKSYFVFEQLEQRFGPGALAKYFRTKRSTLKPGRKAYTMDDCVAVWSRAVGEDLFPWFRSLAFDVHAERTELWPR